jgi:hypothetical protein
MTEAGKMVLAIYSLVVVAVLIFVYGRRLIRGGSKGLELAVLIPVLVFLINLL